MSPVRVTIAEVRGSAPRDPGTAMLVHRDRIEGTIGGGALEWEAMRLARVMLAEGRQHARHVFPLGPALGQCCGGAVTLQFDVATSCLETEKMPVWVWGAGHVSRALVNTLCPLPDISITWVDTGPERFPRDIPMGVHGTVAADPPRLMPRAPTDAHHLIATYSHDIDLALCHAALCHRFATAGVIGSATKSARFRKRLRQLGHGDAQISRIMCPIGDPRLGKHPQAIAIGVATRLLHGQMLKESANQPEHASGGT